MTPPFKSRVLSAVLVPKAAMLLTRIEPPFTWMLPLKPEELEGVKNSVPPPVLLNVPEPVNAPVIA
jgi:hypothetical protein